MTALDEYLPLPETVAEPALAMSDDDIAAFSCELVTNVVERALPFHFTTEVETNPVPFTVRVKPALPGATLAGTSGWLTKGTGLAACARMLMLTKRVKHASKRRRDISSSNSAGKTIRRFQNC